VLLASLLDSLAMSFWTLSLFSIIFLFDSQNFYFLSQRSSQFKSTNYTDFGYRNEQHYIWKMWKQIEVKKINISRIYFVNTIIFGEITLWLRDDDRETVACHNELWR
jgi:hypothetical protein